MRKMKAKFLTVFQILIFSSVFFLRGILSGRHSLRFYRIQNLFRQCGTIKAAVLNEGIIEIEDSALENCVNLKSIRLCAGLKSIGKFSLAGTQIESLEIPEGCHTVKQGAFLIGTKILPLPE